MMNHNIAIVGATGLVGRTMLQVLHEKGYHTSQVRLIASSRSAGNAVDNPSGERYVVHELSESSLAGADYIFFSAGSSVSAQWAPVAVRKGAVVIDNSSFWRMHPNVPLVVPEVNADDLLQHSGIIANPNCSTIQLVAVLKPLQDAFGLRRIVVSTYQSISGAGQKGVDQLMAELQGNTPEARISPHPLAYNTVFHTIGPTGDSEEELKIKHETRRILHMEDLAVAVTCVRIPVLGGHGEAVCVETEQPCMPEQVRMVLAEAPSVVVVDKAGAHEYPTPQSVQGKEEVYVGRIRRDDSVRNGIMLWIAADNLRKGAATNAIQIMESLIKLKEGRP